MSRSLTPADLADPALFSRGIPHRVFDEVRSAPGLQWNAVGGDVDDGFWVVARHAVVVTVSRDTETYSSAVGHIQLYDIDEDALDARASMIDMDPPIHTRLRRLVSAAFTPRHVQSYTPTVRERVRDALDALGDGGDWVETVAKPVPLGVLCDILGVTPVIAPTKKQRRHGVQLSDGVPRCESGQLMTLHFQSESRGACFRCPARRALRGGGFTFERERCLAETPCDAERSVGPTRYVKPGTASLATPKLPYDSDEFKRLYKQRPAVERIFSVLKSPCRLIRTRRAAVIQALVVFQGISIHVNAWMRQDQRAAAPHTRGPAVLLPCQDPLSSGGSGLYGRRRRR